MDETAIVSLVTPASISFCGSMDTYASQQCLYCFGGGSNASLLLPDILAMFYVSTPCSCLNHFSWFRFLRKVKRYGCQRSQSTQQEVLACINNDCGLWLGLRPWHSFGEKPFYRSSNHFGRSWCYYACMDRLKRIDTGGTA